MDKGRQTAMLDEAQKDGLPLGAETFYPEDLFDH
jgi:hypothetical protein